MKQETPKQHVELINDNIEEFDKAIELFKQETTLEKAAERYNLNTINAFGDYQSFIDGAKWQKERSYSEEDLKDAFQSGFTNGFNINSVTFEEWFEQFKNK